MNDNNPNNKPVGLELASTPNKTTQDYAYLQQAGYEAGVRQRQEEARNKGNDLEQKNNDQGIIGDSIDAFQKGALNSVAGTLETAGQLSGSETTTNMAEAVYKQGNNQLDQMSEAGKASMQKQAFYEDENGFIQPGELLTDPRGLWLQAMNLTGQILPNVAPAKIGLNVAGRIAARAYAKSEAKQLAKKGMAEEYIEAEAKKRAKRVMDDITSGTPSALTYTAFGAASANGMAGLSTKEEVLSMTAEEQDESNEFRKLYYQFEGEYPNKTVKEKRQLALRTLADRAAVAVETNPALITANVASEFITGKFIDGIFRGAGTNSRIISSTKGASSQFVAEGTQGATEQYAINQGINDSGAKVDGNPWDGVLVAGLNEGVIGGILGGAGGAARPGKTHKENAQNMQPLDLNVSNEANESGMSPIDIDNSNFEQSSEQETEDLVAQLRQERQDFSGIDRDIRVAEKQGFEEQAVRLRAAKRNFEMAQDFMQEGDEQASIRFRERGMKIYKDVMGDNEASPSQQQEPTNQFPAEYTAEGELIETGSFPSTQVNQGEVYQQEADPMSMGSPAPQMTDQNVRDEIHIPAQDMSQIAGNKNNGIDGPATAVGRASVMPSGVLDPNIVQYEAANENSNQVEHELQLEQVDSIPYERPTMDNIIDRLAGNVQNEIDSYADKKRAQRMSEGLDNDARVLREPFRQRLALTADQLKGKKRASSQVNPNEDSLLDAVAKLGGIDAREAISEGLDASDTVAINRAQFHKSFKARGGKSVDEMAESLSQYGFVSQDYTKNELLDKLRSAIAGNDVYSNFKNYDGEDYVSWFKEAPQEVVGLGRQGIAIAINHALNGKNLGSKQAKAVKYVMDLESSERQERFETQIRPLRDRINSYRALLKNPPKDMRDDPAVQVIEDRRADTGSLQQDTDAMAIIMVEAKELGISDNVIDKIIDKSNGDPIAAGLYLDEALNGNLAPLNNSSTIEQALGIKNDRSNEDPIDSGRAEQKQGPLSEASGRNNGPEVQDVSSNGKRTGGQVEAEEPLLTSYSEEDLAQLNADEAKKQQEAEQAKIADENKAKADIETDRFNLSGSDLPADKANAQGQSDLLSEPTPSQKEAGNYKKKHIRMHGLEISIENQAGSVRSGTDEQGNEWSNEIHYDYGDIKGTTGADGDPIDVFIGKNLTGKKVFVVNQTHPNGKFDEHKVMLGFNSKDAAEAGYLKNYNKDWANYSGVVDTSIDDFKAWLDQGDHKKPFIVNTNKRKSYGWSRYLLAKNYTAKELGEWISELESDSENKYRPEERPSPEIIYKPDADKKMEALGWAVTNRLKMDREQSSQVDSAQSSKKSQLSKVIKEVSREPDSDFTDEDKVPSQIISPEDYQESPEKNDFKSGPYSMGYHNAIVRAARSGEISLYDFKAGFQTLINNETEIRKRLNKYNKNVLMGISGRMYFDPRGTKKATALDDVWVRLVESYHLHKEMPNRGAYDPFDVDATSEWNKGRVKKRIEIANSISEADLKDWADKYKEKKEEEANKEKQNDKALSNPESLEEFRLFVSRKGEKALTSEQLAKWDSLIKEEILKKELIKLESDTVLDAVDGDINYETLNTKHTKQGHDLYVVRLTGERLAKDKFYELENKARSIEGSRRVYSSYARDGAIPGFQFTSEDNRNQFIRLLDGEEVNVGKKNKKRYEHKKDKRVSRLLQMADDLEAKAETELNQERKANTVRRAGMAANIEERARGNINFARQMRDIANAVENGNAEVLANVSTQSQLSELNHIFNRLKYEALRKNSDLIEKDNMSRPNWKKGTTIDQKVMFAEFREPEMTVDQLTKIASDLENIKGYMQTSKSIMSKIKGKKLEDRISLSGGSWSKIVEKVKVYARTSKATSYQAEWLREMFLTKDRFDKMGIRNKNMLREALRELQRLNTSESAKADPLIELERSLIGKFKDSDWFNTPEKAAEYVVDLAEIEPDHKVLEPSAGFGHLADKIVYAGVPKENIDTVEIGNELRKGLELKGYQPESGDFLTYRLPAEIEIMDEIASKIEASSKKLDKLNAKQLERVKQGSTRARSTTYNANASTESEYLDSLRVQLVGLVREAIKSGEVIPSRVLDLVDVNYDSKGEYSPLDNELYDRVIMNPPFSKDQDIRHVQRAFDFLKPGGKLVAIVSSMAGDRANIKNKNFREWLDSLSATEEMLDSGSFKSAVNSTGVNTKVIVIDKPHDRTLARLDDDSPNNQLASMLAAINQSLEDPATERDFHLEHAKTVEGWIADTEKELGIKVNVVPSVNQLPLMTMARLSKYGYLSAVKGVYEDGEMYLVANRIADEADAVKITLHEALGHYGVMGYLGKELEPTIKEIYKGLGRKAFEKFADPDYYDLDLNTEDGRRIAVLEYIAHAAETGKKIGMVKRFIAAIKQALRKVFPGSKLFEWSDIDVLALIENARDSMGSGVSKNSSPDTLASIKESEAGKYRSELSKLMSSKKTLVQPVSIGHTPEVLKALGAPDLDLVILRDTIRKAVNGVKHSVSMNVIEQLPELLNDPIAVFEAGSPEGSLIVLVDAKDADGNQIIVPVHINQKSGRLIVNRIASVYGKQNLEGLGKKNKLRYKNEEKDPESVRLIRLWMHASGSPAQGLKSNILTPSDIVNLGEGDTLARLQEPSKTSDKFTDLNSAQEAFLNKIGRPTIKQAAIHKIKEVTDNLRLKVRQGLVDRYAALMDLDKKLYGKDALTEENISSSAWVRAKMSNVASGAVSALMNAGRIYLDPKDKVIDVSKDTNGLVHVLNKLGGSAEIERFMGWIAANRASKLMDEGRENLFTDDEVKAGAKLNKGKLADGRDRSSTYEAVFEEFQQHRDDVLTIAEKAGIITSENKEMWSDEFYVPFYRIMEDMDEMKGPATMGGISRQQAYKKLKGGDQQLNDLLENTIMNFHHLIDASMKNIAAKQAIDNAAALEVAQKVPESAKGKHSTFILEDGQKVWYDIDDPLVFTAVTSLAHTGFNGSAMKVMRGFKRIFTSFTTSSPQFMVANLIRDSLHSTAVSDIDKNAFKNVSGGLKSYLNDFEKARLNATGGSFNFGHLFGEDSDAIKWQVDKEFRKSKLINKPSDVHHIFRAAWDKWQAGGNALENVNRASVFKQNEGKGKLYAAYQARDLMDFSAHGAWPAIRVLIDVVPFLNARLQGLDKMWRDGIKPSAKVIRSAMGMGDVSVSERKAAKRFSAVAGTMALASVALYLHNQDDDEYQKLEDWQKDTYWFFRIGENGFFIPKPFEIGAMATLAERLTEQMVDDKVSGKVFSGRLGHMLSDTFSFSPIPQAFQPVLDVYSNKDAFTGRDIESAGMERLSPSQRSRASTTNIAKSISSGLENTAGAVFGKDSSLVLSPVQIDHLIGAYLGWLGTSVTATADVVAKSALGETNPEKAWHEYQPIRRFYRDLEVPGYTRHQTEFYDQLKEVGQIYSDINNFRKLGDTESALSLMAENKDKLKKRLMLNKVQRQLQKINARMKVIQNSDRDGAWKRRELDRLKLMKERIVGMVSVYA